MHINLFSVWLSCFFQASVWLFYCLSVLASVSSCPVVCLVSGLVILQQSACLSRRQSGYSAACLSWRQCVVALLSVQSTVWLSCNSLLVSTDVSVVVLFVCPGMSLVVLPEDSVLAGFVPLLSLSTSPIYVSSDIDRVRQTFSHLLFKIKSIKLLSQSYFGWYHNFQSSFHLIICLYQLS